MSKKMSKKRTEDNIIAKTIKDMMQTSTTSAQISSVQGTSHKQQESTSTSNNQTEFEILNINEELETVCFSSDKTLETVQLEDSTVELIGFIDDIEGPRIVGKSQNYRLLKFVLNNNSQHRIQIVAWNKEIEKVEHHMKPNYIIHIDGGKAKIPKVQGFNRGTLPYEIIIQSNTIINNIGSFDLKSKIGNGKCDKLTNLEDIPRYLNKFIHICGFVKTNFNCAQFHQRSVGYESITDGIYKLEVQINEDYENNIYEKGQHIMIKGYVKIKSSDIFYIDVEKMSDVKLINEEKMSFLKRLNGTKSLKRQHIDNNYETVEKITKI